MQNFIEYILFVSFSLVLRVFPLNIARKFAFPLTWLFFYLIPIRKQVVLKNLSIAFPEKSTTEINELAFGCYRNFAITLIEILYIPSIKRSQMEAIVKCPNKEMIADHYKYKKGVILLSAHFGNWEYNAASVSLQTGIPVSLIVKPQRNHFVTKWLSAARTRWNNKEVPLGISIRQIYKELKDKNVVAMIADQRGPSEGMRVNFFGRQVSIYTGPASLAIKTGAPVIYGVSVRQKDYSYRTVLEKINTDNLPENEEEKVRELSQRHASYLENMIRQFPDQWFWMHNLWKY